jgi:hypothetical protein
MGESYLVLDQELDTLNWSGSSLGDGSGNTTHYKPVSKDGPHRDPTDKSRNHRQRHVKHRRLCVRNRRDKHTQEIDNEALLKR